MLAIFQTFHKARSQMRYLFTCGGTTISWRSIKQIMETCEVSSIRGNATKSYEDNVVYIVHIKDDALRVIKLSIYLQSSFTFISFRRVTKLLFNE